MKRKCDVWEVDKLIPNRTSLCFVNYK